MPQGLGRGWAVGWVRASVSARVRPSRQLTSDHPEGIESGDVLVAVAAVSENATVAPPDGWVRILSDRTGPDLRQLVYIRVLWAGHSSSSTWRLHGSRSATGIVVGYTGVDTGDPVAAVDGSTNQPSTAIAAPSIPAGAPGRSS